MFFPFIFISNIKYTNMYPVKEEKNIMGCLKILVVTVLTDLETRMNIHM